MTDAPSFPPLLNGVSLSGATDPFDKACAMAALGCDGGTVVHNLQADKMRVALVFAPEVPLSAAMAIAAGLLIGFPERFGCVGAARVSRCI